MASAPNNPLLPFTAYQTLRHFILLVLPYFDRKVSTENKYFFLFSEDYNVTACDQIDQINTGPLYLCQLYLLCKDINYQLNYIFKYGH